MTFNPLTGKIIGEIAGHETDIRSVVELGNQTFTVTDKVMRQVAGYAGSRINSDALEAIQALAPMDRAGKVADYYKALGFDEYVAIDVNEKFGSIKMDLNENLKEFYGYEKQFDLVTNNGTGEHIFDQAMVFKNMHQLTTTGGLMLHVMPFVHWENHGFYNYNPILYLDLASANAYEVVRLSLASRWGDEILVNVERGGIGRTQENGQRSKTGSIWGRLPGGKQLADWRNRLQIVSRKWSGEDRLNLQDFCEHIKYPGQGRQLTSAIRHLQKNRWDNILVTALLRKQKDKPFKNPIQGKYFQDVNDASIEARYA